MDNLHRSLAPISDAASEDLEEEAKRTFKRHIAGRRVVDVSGPHGEAFGAVTTGRLEKITSPGKGVESSLYTVSRLARFRVPFTLSRAEIDAVERGAQDADWDPLKEAAKQVAFAEDRAIFHGDGGAGITGITSATSQAAIDLPADATDVPEAISRALTALRLAGVDGPYAVVLSAALYTKVSEEVDHGYPIREHLSRIVGSEPIWAPAIDGAVVLTTRGGDFDLQLGQDLSIGYLSHDADTVQLYFQESLTFLDYTAEAAVPLR